MIAWRGLPLPITFLLQDSGVGEECFHNDWLFYADTIASNCAVRKARLLQAGKSAAGSKPGKTERVAVRIEHEGGKAGGHRTHRGRLARAIAKAGANAPMLLARFGPGSGLVFCHRLSVGRLPTGRAAPCCSPRRCSTYVPTRSDNLPRGITLFAQTRETRPGKVPNGNRRKEAVASARTADAIFGRRMKRDCANHLNSLDYGEFSSFCTGGLPQTNYSACRNAQSPAHDISDERVTTLQNFIALESSTWNDYERGGTS